MTDSRLAPVLHHLRRLARPEGPSDAALLERFTSRRDATALEELVRRYGPLVWGVCRRMLYHVPDAEDAYQATFLALARRAGAIRKPDALASWLHAVVFRIARRLRHDASRRHCVEADSPHPPTPDPAHEAAWRELGRVVEEEVATLPEKYRLPLLLCYWQGRTNEEAAHQLTCPAGTVKTRLAKARQLLHDRLTRRGVSLPAGVAVLLLAPDPGAAAAPALAANVSARVAALAAAAVRSSAARWLAAVFLLAVGLAAAGAFAFAVPAPQQQTVPPAEKPPARVDRFGDPLPNGVRARLGTSRLRHGNGTTLAFAPDAKSLLTFGRDRTFRTWDLSSGRLVKEQRLPGGALGANGAILSEDGQLVAFQEEAARDACLLWDVVRNRLRHKLPLGGADNYRAVFSPDGKTLVTAGMYSGLLKAWDVDTGRGRTVGRHQAHLRGLSYAAGGTVLSWTDNRNDLVRLWDVKTGRERLRLPVPADTAGAILSPDGRFVASWRVARPFKFLGMQLWDAATGKPVPGGASPDVATVHAVQFTPDGKALLLGTSDGILVWDPVRGKSLRTLPGRPGDSVRFSPDGKIAATLGFAGDIPQSPVVQIWDFATGTPHPAGVADRGHRDEVAGVAFSPDGRVVASSCPADRAVRLWDAATGRPLRTLAVEDQLGIQGLAFSPDGKHLFVGTSPVVIRWEVATGREAGRFLLAEAGQGRRHLLLMNLTDDGRTLQVVCQQHFAKGGGGEGLLTWDVATGKRGRTGVLSPDGHLIAFGRFSGDGRVLVLPEGSVRDGSTGKERLRLPLAEDESAHTPIALSRDAALAASGIRQEINQPNARGSEMIAVQVWETATGLPVMRLKEGKPAQLAFTPDGRCLLAADREELALLDLASGKVVARRPAPSFYYGMYGASFVSAWALAPDGRTLATGHTDTTVLLWDIPAPPRAAVSLTAREREALWADLAGDDAGRAWQAVARLADAPATVPLLRERLRPAKGPPAEELRRLIADLDSARYEARDAAAKRLAELEDGAHAALRAALSGQPSLEVRRRIEPLLDRPLLVKEPELRRSLRAVSLLERVGTPAARRVLEALASGTDGMRLTEAARAARLRLAR